VKAEHPGQKKVQASGLGSLKGHSSSGRATLLEFSNSHPSESISHALCGRLGGQTIELDIIGEQYGRETDLAHRAKALAAAVVGVGAERVLIAASCAAASVLVPVSTELAKRGVDVGLIAAVDPSPVTEDHIHSALETMAMSLGRPLTGSTGPPHPDLEAPARDILAEIEDVLHEWVEEYLRTSSLPASDHDLVRIELLDRYLRWYSFLVAAFRAPRHETAHPVDVLLTQSAGADAAGVFAPGTPIRYHRYHGGSAPALTRNDLVGDLCTLLKEGG
jgi:hypothetical protein